MTERQIMQAKHRAVYTVMGFMRGAPIINNRLVQDIVYHTHAWRFKNDN